MLIHMLETRRGSEDGLRVRCFHRGGKYSVVDRLAYTFLCNGVACRIMSATRHETIIEEHKGSNMGDGYTERLLSEATPPATEPLTLAETKLYLRVDGTDEDSLISDMIVAAREAAEHYLRRSLITRQWTLAYNDCVSGRVPLPMGPVQSIVDVRMIAEDSTETIVDTSLYTLSAARTHLCFSQSVSAHRIEITYEAGYGMAADIPYPIRQGMLSHIAELFDGRAAAGFLPDSALALFLPYREVTL